MSADWEGRVPANTSVYGTKTIDCSDEEWRVRVDLAAAYRQFYRKNLCEGINNHLTAAIPGTRDRFLVFPFGLMWSEVTASSLLVVDSEGKVLSGNGEPETTAFYIHSRLHLKHPKAACVMHTHQPWVTSLCCLEDSTLPMVHQNSLRFYNDIVYDSYNGLVHDNSEGDHLAEVMGEKRVLMHQSHGIMVCAETVAAAFELCYYIEQAARVTVQAMSTGKPLRLVPKHVCEQFKSCIEGGMRQEYARLYLEALKREMLAGQDADFLT